MPSLGADMAHGTLVRWAVHAGDTVHRGDIVGEVETDKGVFDIDSLEDGVVEELLVTEGTRVPVQTTLARLRPLGLAGATPRASETSGPTISEPHAGPAPIVPMATDMATAARTTGESARQRVSPLARRVAADRGIDLTMVSGTGDGGAITRADVERAADDGTAVAARSTIVTAPATAPATTPAPVPDPHEKTTSAMRDAIGAAMSRSKREIPHYYLSQEMDVARMMGWLHDVNAARPVTERVLPIAVLLSAVAHALPQFQDFNGQFSHGTFRASASVHLGVAVTMHGGGLIAPALRDAECLSTSALMPALLDLVARARTARLRTSELTDATITVTALAEGGVRELYGVIYPPQVAIVGFGAIAERPWAINGLLGVRQTVVATLAADHRVSDGHRGALFLAEIQRLLRSPEAL